MTLFGLLKNELIVSIIGLAKNTGKTVTLNQLADEMSSTNSVFGLTSIGHDGERFDALRDTIDKPRIYLPPGHFVATTDALLQKCTARVRLLETTNYRTALGTVQIGKTEKAGYVEVAGPTTARGARAVANRMLRLGAERVLIDGAFNRKAAGSPAICDGTIVATGAVLGTNVNQVVRETKHSLQLLALPAVQDDTVRRMASDCDRSIIIGPRYCVAELDIAAPLASRKHLGRRLSDGTEYVVFRKSLVESLVDEFARIRRGRPLTIVVRDSSKLFIPAQKLSWYEKMGILLRVLHQTNLISLTINPISPESHRFESDELLSRMQEEITDVPVFDVLGPGYSRTRVGTSSAR